ncbi:MAG: putative glycoside hydrolase [Spirochaetota bacterium]|nr:putative glycoside hydrolase [Spirochaetota bacterium]
MKSSRQNRINLLVYLILFLLPILIMFHVPMLYSSDMQVILLSAERGLLISGDEGHSWQNFNMGLPMDFIPEKMLIDKNKNLYLITGNSGIFRFENQEYRWKDLNTPDFLARYGLSNNTEYRKISAIDIDDDNPDVMVLATKHTIFKTIDGGKGWGIVSMNGLKKRNYITALAVRDNTSEFYTGTSFNGLYKKRNTRFVSSSSGLPREPYAGKLCFSEEISVIAFDNSDQNTLYAGLSFSGGIYISSDKGKSWSNLNMPIEKKDMVDIYGVIPFRKYLFVSTSIGVYRMDLASRRWSIVSFNTLRSRIPENLSPLSLFIVDRTGESPSIYYHINDFRYQKNNELSSRASGKRGIYSSIWSTKKNFNGLLETMKACNLNSIVIDMKDDLGYIFSPSENRYAKEIGAVKGFPDIAKYLEILKGNGIYSIARIVVFKDRCLYRAYNNKYAIWDKKMKKPWKGNSREFWVDPHSDFVKQYNIDIAAEIEHLGFDEIQFDYIRFPSDGPISRCDYRYNDEKDVYKSEVMIHFLRKAREKIAIPISVDVYGYNAWYHFGNWIGQDIEEFAKIVDVICPMVYPSHFGKKFYMKGPRELRPYRIVFHSGKRAKKLVAESALLRPYIQAFRMSSPTWGKGYINNQIRGVFESGCCGFTLWNARGDYKMVRKALSPLTASNIE